MTGRFLISDFRFPIVNRPTVMAALVGFILVAAGCNNANEQVAKLETRIRSLEEKNTAQAREIIDREENLRTLQRQLQTLTGMGGPDRLKELALPDRVELEGLSGGYDRDDLPGDEGAVAYLRVIDADADVVKAPGAAHMQVLDLANPATEQLVVERRWNPAELRKQWYGRMMTQHYTLRCPWSEKGPPRHSTLTLRVVFYDLLTGRTFEIQKQVEVKLPAAAKR